MCVYITTITLCGTIHLKMWYIYFKITRVFRSSNCHARSGVIWYDVPVQPGMVRARHNVTYKFDHDSSGNGNGHPRNVCCYSELRCERFKRVMSVTTLIFQLLLCCVWCRDSTEHQKASLLPQLPTRQTRAHAKKSPFLPA